MGGKSTAHCMPAGLYEYGTFLPLWSWRLSPHPRWHGKNTHAWCMLVIMCAESRPSENADRKCPRDATIEGQTWSYTIWLRSERALAELGHVSEWKQAVHCKIFSSLSRRWERLNKLLIRQWWQHELNRIECRTGVNVHPNREPYLKLHEFICADTFVLNSSTVSIV